MALEEKMYLLTEAKVILARQECEERGHRIESVLRQRNGNREVVVDLYHCTRGCGVTVTVAYTEAVG